MRNKNYSTITIVNPKTIKKASYVALAGTVLAGIGLAGYLMCSPLEKKASASRPKGQIIFDDDFMKEEKVAKANKSENKLDNPRKLEKKVNQVSDKKTEQEFSIEKLKKESERILFARMLFGEARDCNYNEKIMIGYTVIDRKRYWYKNKKELSEILLQPKVYSCFWENSKNNNLNKWAIMNPEKTEKKEWELCLKAVDDILANKYPHLNKRQTFYHTKSIEKPESWGEVKKLNFKNAKTKHIFYKG